ncbi:MAG: right-handed parallel beta-helix repeat-containing protein [Lentisphaeria bacterium]|nr:right-handed parallel beta-helix repeat-containing protein [Lentisphaeria bacterium]
MSRTVMGILGLGCACQVILGAGIELHVSPTGDDAAAGSRGAPFRTLGRARDALRAGDRSAGATVILHRGTYFHPEPVVFTAVDSGTADAPVVVRAAEGEEVWLNGGIPLPLAGFGSVTDAGLRERLDPAARDRVRQTALPEEILARLPPEWPDTWWNYGRGVSALAELFLAGRRLPMARWPNEGYATFGEIIVPAENEGDVPEFAYTGDRPARWAASVPEGLWLYGYWRRGYRAESIRVKTIDRAAKRIALAARNSLGPLETGGASRYCALHVLEELDTPGEWYLDRGRGILLLWPPEQAAADELVLSVNPAAVLHCVETSHLTFRGLGIECAAGCGVRVEKGTGCLLVGCEIRNVGVHGVAVTGSGNAVVGCDIHHTGDKAVEMDSGDRATLTPGASLIDNCHLHHTNRVVRAGSQAVSLLGVGNRFSHNLIHDTGYIAVRFAGNDHVLEYNRLFRTNVESAEGGVFYTGRDWTSRGSVIRHNFIHHVEDTQEGCGSSTRFVHLDDSAPEIEIHGNVCYRMGGGVSICGGAANHVHDNLFVECAWGVDIGPRGMDMFEPDGQGGFRMAGMEGWTTLARYLQRYRWNEPPYSSRYPKLVEIFSRRPIAAPWFNTVTRNVMVDCGHGIRSSAMEPGWSTVEGNWEGGDPGFVEKERAALDFRLLPDAPVLAAVGFQPPAVETAGLYASADRRSWPVPLDLPQKDWKPRWMRLREEARKSPIGLPVFRVMPTTGTITIDGIVDPMEWTPGDATGSAPEIHDTAELAWTHTGGKAARPSQAMLQTDASCLYIHFRNPIDPAAGVTGGHRWGRDDAVEVALAEARGETLGPTLVLRGYADGHWESSDEAGAPPAAVSQAARDVAYAARLSSPGLWCAEWRIPFASLGLDLPRRNPRLLFNLSVRKPAGDEWVMWNRKGGSTWDVRRSGFLWLAQFGDMAPGRSPFPSEARVDIDSRQRPVRMKADSGCSVAAWAQPAGCYLSATLGGLPADGWKEMVFSFTPLEDGRAVLKLMGAGHRLPGSDEFVPVWVYSDDIRVEGAELANGSFEEAGERGLPRAWRADVREGFRIRDPALAAAGEYCVKTAHNHRFAQEIALTAGRTVTVRLKVRGIE